MKQFLILSLIVIFTNLQSLHANDSKQVLGWLETVRISPEGLKMRAKLDTGAKSSSLNVTNLKRIKGDKDLVRFTIMNDRETRHREIKKQVIRTVKIKLKEGGAQERFVVPIELCLAGKKKKIEMNLVDRSHFNYQVLIGRDDLADDFIIDPSMTFTSSPDCRQVTP